MSSFCGGTGTPPTFTDSELQRNYVGALAVLPPSLPTVNDIGLVSPDWLNSYMSSLESRGIIPNPPNTTVLKPAPVAAPESQDPLKPHIEKEKALVDSIKMEYCWYETRYYAALDSFLRALTDPTPDTRLVEQKLEVLKLLNRKVNVLIQVTNRIAKRRYEKTQQYQNEINSINTTLSKRGEQIRQQAEIYNRESAAADLHKRMVEYTLEKNKANHNLLALYGMLNLIAIGIIVYIAKK